jgi:Uma2 family endonuclease
MSETIAAKERNSSVNSTVVTPKTRRRRLPLPLSFEERADMGKREVRVPATFEEYLDLSAECDYRVFYRNGHIISFIEIDEQTKTIMGEATVTHERIVARMIHFLTQILDIDSDFSIMGSNAKIFIAEDKKGYNPDAVVVQGEIEQKSYKSNKRTTKGIANPYIIVEVLSDGTRNFDLSEKLEDYKQIPSVQQIIYVDQNNVWASTYIRQSTNQWLNIDYTTLEEKIPVQDGFISLEKIYSKIFEATK